MAAMTAGSHRASHGGYTDVLRFPLPTDRSFSVRAWSGGGAELPL